MYFALISLVMEIMVRAVLFSGFASEAKLGPIGARFLGVTEGALDAERLVEAEHDLHQLLGRYVFGEHLEVDGFGHHHWLVRRARSGWAS